MLAKLTANNIHLILFFKKLLGFSEDVFQLGQLQEVLLQSLGILIDLYFKSQTFRKCNDCNQRNLMSFLIKKNQLSPLAIHVQVFRKWPPCRSSHEAEVRPVNLRHPVLKNHDVNDLISHKLFYNPD